MLRHTLKASVLTLVVAVLASPADGQNIHLASNGNAGGTSITATTAVAVWLRNREVLDLSEDQARALTRVQEVLAARNGPIMDAVDQRASRYRTDLRRKAMMLTEAERLALHRAAKHDVRELLRTAVLNTHAAELEARAVLTPEQESLADRILKRFTEERREAIAAMEAPGEEEGQGTSH